MRYLPAFVVSLLLCIPALAMACRSGEWVIQLDLAPHSLDLRASNSLAAGRSPAESIENVTVQPRRDGFRFALRDEVSGRVRVTVLDVMGRAVTHFEDRLESRSHELYWDGLVNGSRARAGVYFTRVDDGSGRTATGKTVVTR